MSLRWLALFHYFEEAREANWGQVCLAYLYSSLDTLSRGTLHQLLGPWKLLEVSLSSFSLLWLMYIHLYVIQAKMCIMLLQTIFMFPSCKLSSCKLFTLVHLYFLQTVILQTIILKNYHLANYHLANCHLVNRINSFCKLSLCKLSSCKFHPFIRFQCWAIQYGLITHGANVDLKSFSSIRAHFERLSSNEVSQHFNASRYFSCMSLRVFLL